MAEQTYGEGKGSSGKPWSRRLKDLIVTRGIRFVCGSSAALSPNVANDVPLMSAALRMALLRGLRICGVRRITGTSPFGHKFVCHTGDLAEYPYYHRRACEKELALCSAWLDGSDRPNIFDLGANVGFFATQLAQLLRSQRPRIFAFEPVPYTYAKLRESIEILGLQDVVQPIKAAVMEAPGQVHVYYSEKNSLFAQVGILGTAPHPRVGNQSTRAAAISLDHFCSLRGRVPALIKMDVEGSEVDALRGARALLSREDRPALLFEYNPVALAERGANAQAFEHLLSGYSLRYVDDFEGQRRPFGAIIARLNDLDWPCNLFAVPLAEGTWERWAETITRANNMLKNRPRT
jgi:FkbM family methyltransferase